MLQFFRWSIRFFVRHLQHSCPDPRVVGLFFYYNYGAKLSEQDRASEIVRISRTTKIRREQHLLAYRLQASEDFTDQLTTHVVFLII